MARKIMKWGLIACILLASPLVYTEVQAFLTTNGAFPTINAFSAKSKTALAVIFITFNLITAALTAIITVLPAGFLEPKQPKIIASLFVLLAESLPVYAFFQQPKITAFTTVVMTGQFIAFVLTAECLQSLGAVLQRRKCRRMSNRPLDTDRG